MAIGTPFFVTTKGSPVFFTRSNSLRHVALKWDMAIVSMITLFFGQITMVRDYSQRRDGTPFF